MRPLHAQRRTPPTRRRRAPATKFVALLGSVLGSVASIVAGGVLGVGCPRETGVDVYVDGFEPENVRFEVEELGTRTQAELIEQSQRGDIDGLLLLPAGACGGSCRAAVVSIFVHNRGGAEAPPVVRLKVPDGKPARAPIAFRGGEISQGRIGRVRWIVELWPQERRLTATISSSVHLVETPAPAPAPVPAAPQNEAPLQRSPAR